MDAAVPCTLSEPSRTYMYFQQMNTNHHSLTLTNDEKCRDHLPKRDLEKMKCEVSVLGGSRHAYAKTDLAITPHGSELTAEKMVIDDLLERAGVPQVTAIQGGKRGIVDLSKLFGLVVLYSNACFLNRDTGRLDLEERLMRYYLSMPCEDQQDTTRNSGFSDTCLRRRWWGFSQNMPVPYKSNRQFNLNTRRVIVNRGCYIDNMVSTYRLVQPKISTPFLVS